MRAHEWFVEHRVDHAIRTLDPDDAATFEAHLPHCEECRREVARIAAELAWLPMGLAPAAPRPGFRRRIIHHVLEGRTRGRRAWLMPAALAASLLLAVGIWYAGSRRAAGLRDQLSLERTRVEALADTLSIMRGAGKVLQANVSLGGSDGGVVIFADETTHRWNVVVHGLPPAPLNDRYQFWFICADGMVRGGEVRLNEKGQMMFTTGMPETGGTVLGAALTIEPRQATTGPPQGRTLAHLML